MTKDTIVSGDAFPQKIKRGLIELISVIIGILLALAINEWWEDREIAERTQTLTEKLYVELSENVERLETAHAHHELQLQTIRDGLKLQEILTEEDYRSIYSTLYRRGVFKRAQLTGVNWEIAKFTGLMTYMPIEDLQTLASLFAMQKAYDEQWTHILQRQSAVELQAQDLKTIVVQLGDSMNEVWWIEKALLEETKRTLAARKGKTEEVSGE